MRRALPFVAMLAAACTAAPPQAAPGTSSAPPTTTTTTSATPPAELAPKRVRSATLPADALARLGVTEPGTDSNRRSRLPLPCANPKTTGQDVFGYHVTFSRQWQTSGYEFNHLVTWYEGRTGADAVAKTREMAQSCQEYVYPTKEAGDQTLRVTAPVEVLAPAGVSANYTYCEDNGTVHACWSLIAHDDMVSTLIVFSASQDRSMALVAEMLPATAELLDKA
ncbi:hypothetical protein ACQPW3_25025 [Actinosynnema sp. CA-248983]